MFYYAFKYAHQFPTVIDNLLNINAIMLTYTIEDTKRKRKKRTRTHMSHACE